MRTSPEIRRRLTVALVLGIGACAQEPDGTYDFALIGDNPYSPEKVADFRALIEDVNSQADLEWVLHVGDIRGGGPTAEPCTDEVLTGRFELYQGLEMPLVYTPGDNDWFDCANQAAGAYDEYERLSYLRSLFFADPGRTTGGRAMEVRSQATGDDFSEFVENALWTRGNVVFATVHLVALTRPPNEPDVATRRMDAAVNWIDTAFEEARVNGNAGVFIATQVDPWVIWGLPPIVERLCPTCLEPRAGLEPLYAALLRNATTFSGPVVLAVGDTHVFRVDKPLYRGDGTLVENFTRVETFGHPNVHWIRVTVDPGDRGVFTFRQERVPENVGR